MLFSVVSSLKYEMAIVLPQSDSEAKKIYQLSIFILFLFSLIILLIFILLQDFFLSLLNAENIKGYVLLIPFGIFCYGLLEIVKYGLIRKKNFNKFAFIRVSQVSVTQVCSIGIGLFHPEIFTLIFSYILGIIVSITLFIKNSTVNITQRSVQNLKELVLRYKKFPTINSSLVFLNTLSNELPIFFLSKYFSMEMVGLFMLANRIAIIPLNLIGSSVNKVYFQKASESFNENPSLLLRDYTKTVKRLALIGIIPFSLILIFSPLFTRIIFGSEWEFSGMIMQILSLSMFFKFITSPISTTFTVLDKQEIGLFLTLLSIIIRFSVMYYFRETIMSMLWALVFSTTLYYLMYNLCVYFTLLRKVKTE